jgi:NADH dehydrogenase FAD-containing subunit
VYILPRLAVLAGHEHKACRIVPYIHIHRASQLPHIVIPYNKVFLQDDNSDLKYNFICAQIMSLGRNSVTLSKAFPEYGIDSEVLEFDYAVYALGSHMPQPLNLWGAESGAMPSSPAYGGTKPESIAWLKRKQKTIEDASTVLVVGGGALGIRRCSRYPDPTWIDFPLEFASDIAAIHPGKQVTLLHSRSRLLPRFDEVMHTESRSWFATATRPTNWGSPLQSYNHWNPPMWTLYWASVWNSSPLHQENA